MTNSSEVSSYYKVSVEERQFCTWVRLLINGGIGGLVCILGLVGNFIAYLVLNRGKQTSPVATFLLRCLALTDNFFLLVWLINFSLRDLLRYVKHNPLTWKYVRLYTYPTIYIAQCATIWLTVLIAAARFIAVCKPYISKRICSLPNTKFAVFVLYFLVTCYNLPRFFEAQMIPVNGSLQIRDTWLGSNETYRLIYWQILYYILTFGLPLTALCVLNVRLTLAYRGVVERRRQITGQMTRSSQDDANITLVMIVVVAVFVVCQLPARVVQIIWNYNFGTCRTAPFFLMEFSTILEVLNSSVNFLIYSFIRPQFRKSLKGFCCSPAECTSKNNIRLLSPDSEPNDIKNDVSTTGTTVLPNKEKRPLTPTQEKESPN